MRLIVGLGNPGPEYANHRHNVGFMCIDAIADKHRNGQFLKKFQGLAKQINLAGQRTLLLKPQTFMNTSGTSVAKAARFYKIAPKDVLVIHDDLDLAPGTARVKSGGGAGGHNGLKSIDAHLGNNYQRLRIGIGHPGEKARVNGHVLSNFSADDLTWLAPLLAESAHYMDRLLRGDTAGFLKKLAVARSEPDTASKTFVKRENKAETTHVPSPQPDLAKTSQNKTGPKTSSKASEKRSNSIWQALKDRWHANG